MIVWIDAQLPPRIAVWLAASFGVNAVALRDLGLRDATDPEIFAAARRASAVLMTKDSDFVELVGRLGAPPQVIWITSGNTSNARLREILSDTFPRAVELLLAGEKVVEIREATAR